MASEGRLIGLIMTLWEEAEHDHARHGMYLTLKQDCGVVFPPIDYEGTPTTEQLRDALVADLARKHPQG